MSTAAYSLAGGRKSGSEGDAGQPECAAGPPSRARLGIGRLVPDRNRPWTLARPAARRWRYDVPDASEAVAIEDDYWIEDEQGNRVCKVNGRALRVRDTLVFEDAAGHALLKVQERKLRVRDTMEIEDASGRTVAP